MDEQKFTKEEVEDFAQRLGGDVDFIVEEGVKGMLVEPNCSKRNCKYFLGVRQDDVTELKEVVVCSAFPKGIPDEIAHGENKHIEPYPGDHGIQYRRDEE